MMASAKPGTSSARLSEKALSQPSSPTSCCGLGMAVAAGSAPAIQALLAAMPASSRAAAASRAAGKWQPGACGDATALGLLLAAGADPWALLPRLLFRYDWSVQVRRACGGVPLPHPRCDAASMRRHDPAPQKRPGRTRGMCSNMLLSAGSLLDDCTHTSLTGGTAATLLRAAQRLARRPGRLHSAPSVQGRPCAFPRTALPAAAGCHLLPRRRPVHPADRVRRGGLLGLPRHQLPPAGGGRRARNARCAVCVAGAAHGGRAPALLPGNVS